MRYLSALILTAGLGAAASLYAPGAKAGVYLGVGVPAPVVAPRLVVGVRPVAPYYYSPPLWFRAGYFGPRFWGYGHVYGHRYYYGGHGWGGHGWGGHGWGGHGWGGHGWGYTHR